MNDSNCLFCGAENPPSRGKKRKYCSPKCAQKFYTKEGRYNKHKKPGNAWGTLTAKRMAARDKRRIQLREEFEWHKENWLTVQQLGELLGISANAVHHRAKKAEAPPKLVWNGIAPTAFWDPDGVEKLKYTEAPIPEGYITRKEACRILNVSRGTFQTNYSKQIQPDMIWHQTHGHKSMQHLYLRETIEAYAGKRKSEAIAKAAAIKANADRREKEKIARRIKREKELAAKRAQREFDKAERRRLKKLQVEETKRKWKERRRERVPNRKTDWQSAEEREKRLFGKFPSILEKYADNPRKYEQHICAIEANKKYARLALSGVVHEFACKKCDTEKPYFEFYYDGSYSEGRRTTICRQCQTKISKSKYMQNKEAIRENRRKNYRSKMRILVANTIKQDVSRMRKEYAQELSLPYVWKKLEENCDYDIDKFIAHIENQFDENMHWLNHGRGREQYYWQIDHITPRSNFVYTDLDDLNFIKCWSLENLQPLSAYENMVKDNHRRIPNK